MPDYERARSLLAKDTVDLAVVTSPANVRYFSQQRPGVQSIVGWWDAPTMVLLAVSRDRNPLLIVNSMDAPTVLEEKQKPCEPKFYGKFVMNFAEELDEEEDEVRRMYRQCRAQPKDAFQLLFDFIESWGPEDNRLNVGIEARHFPALARDMLRERFPQLHFKNVSHALLRARMIKTEEETEKIKQSSAINVKAFLATVEEIRPGAEERLLTETYVREVQKHGARPVFALINAGRKSAVLFPSYKKSVKIRKGDTVRLDVGCEYMGYCSDVSRTVAVGDVSRAKRRILEATTSGYTQTIKRLRPGLAIREIFEHAVSTVRAAGIPDYERTNVGHGIGIEVHELPNLTPDEDGILEKNMVLNVETPYYCFGVGGFSCEDTVRITEDGCELLTRLRRRIQI